MNSEANWALDVDPAVYKVLGKMSRYDAERVLAVLRDIPLDPFDGDIAKMKGVDNTWRRRIGAYRLFYEIISHERAIYVFRLERRTSNTY